LGQIREAIEHKLKKFKKDLNTKKRRFEERMESLDEQTADLMARYEDISMIHAHNKQNYESFEGKPIKIGKILAKKRKEMRKHHNLDIEMGQGSPNVKYGQSKLGNFSLDTSRSYLNPNSTFLGSVDKKFRKLDDSARCRKKMPKQFTLNFKNSTGSNKWSYYDDENSERGNGSNQQYKEYFQSKRYSKFTS
jgi:hypothetical protein